MTSPQRCPMCNGDMDYAVMFERLEVCIDCHDGMSGKGRGATRARWQRADEAARARTLRRLVAEQKPERSWHRRDGRLVV